MNGDLAFCLVFALISAAAFGIMAGELLSWCLGL